MDAILGILDGLVRAIPYLLGVFMMVFVYLGVRNMLEENNITKSLVVTYGSLFGSAILAGYIAFTFIGMNDETTMRDAFAGVTFFSTFFILPVTLAFLRWRKRARGIE